LDAGSVCAAVYRPDGSLFQRRSRTLTVAHLAGRFQAVLKSIAQKDRRSLIVGGVDYQAVLQILVTPGDIATVKRALPV
jgi:hypothetical protein